MDRLKAELLVRQRSCQGGVVQWSEGEKGDVAGGVWEGVVEGGAERSEVATSLSRLSTSRRPLWGFAHSFSTKRNAGSDCRSAGR